MNTHNNNIPALRFREFSGEWEEKKLSSLFDFNIRHNSLSRDQLNYEGGEVKNIHYGDILIKYGSIVNAEEDSIPYITCGKSSNYSQDKLEDGDVIFADTAEDFTAGKAIEIQRTNDSCVVAGLHTIVARPRNPFSKGFLGYGLNANTFHNQLIPLIQGTKVCSINKSSLADTSLVYPSSLAEQQELGNYFSALDVLLLKSSCRVEKLKQVKAACLQNMFPKKGHNIPNLRFKGFSAKWETPSIEEVFNIRNGYTPSKAVKAYWEGGTIPWFRMEDIRENGGILSDAIQHITPLGVKGNGLFEKNSIILSTTATIGVHAMLIADSLANQQFTNFSIRKSLCDKYDSMFVYYSFFGIDEWSKKNTNSGGLLSVNVPLLLKQPFLTPSLAEQQKIGEFFSTLDAKISLESARVEKLKQIKAACLRRMFP